MVRPSPRRSGPTGLRDRRSTGAPPRCGPRPAGTAASATAVSTASPRALADPHLRAVGHAEPRQRHRVHPRARRPRVGGLLQRRRAADQRIGEVDRHVGDALEAGRRARPAAPIATPVPLASRDASVGGVGQDRRPDLVDRLVGEAVAAQQRAEHAQHLPRRPRVAARLDHAVEALDAALAVDEGAGGLGERRDRQQRVGVLRAVAERGQRDDEFRLLQRGARGDRVGAVELGLGVQQQVGLARIGQHRGGVEAALAAAARRRRGRRRCSRPRRGSRASRR